MQGLFGRLSSRSLSLQGKGCIFFVLYFFFLWLWVKPQVIFHGGGEFTNFPSFYTGWAFFNEVFMHPGGLVEYSSAFLSQLLYIGWAGAIVLTMHALLVCVFTFCFLRQLGVSRSGILAFIPPVLLLITYNRYTYHFTTAFALLVTLIFACLYIRIAPKGGVLNVFLFLFFFVILYLIASAASLYFALLCCIYDVLFRRRWITGILEGILAVIVVYVLGILVFSLSLTDVYSKLLPFSRSITEYPERRAAIEIIYAMYLFLPSIAIVFGLWHLFAQSSFYSLGIKSIGKSKQEEAKGKNKKSPDGESAGTDTTTVLHPSKWRECLELFLLLVIAGGTVFSFPDFRRKTLFEVDYYLNNRDWKKVLEIGSRCQDNDRIMHAINRALFHLGLMSSDMFGYQQRPECLLLSSKKEMGSPWHKIDTYYDLGAVNHCESTLVESMEIYGERPELLKKLAIVRIAKNDIHTARVYLEALNKTLFYSGWAGDCLKRLDADPNMFTDKEIQRLRSLMPYEDKGAIEFSIEGMVADLLKRNPKNQMAFEYLMAIYMFMGDLDKFIQNINRLDDFNYPQIPRNYEEAILTYMYLKKKAPDLKGRLISGKTQQRFGDYLQMSSRYRNNQKAGLVPLAQNYGDTYFFYYVYKTYENANR
jgi:hypothetical protein